MFTLRRLFILLAVLFTGAHPGLAQGPTATVREYRKVIRTYPFSDPNPIANVGRVYPYFRYDGYTDAPIDKEWTVVELDNPYLKVTILPEIGGKIWSAVEKSTGRSFIYDNHVVKFRDIAMRGPWTSGGIEANYGIIGHTPNCATPVDYVAGVGPDGTARMVIGVLDLLTRTPWRLEIALPPDTAFFTTRSSWYNPTPLEQPYYSWMNAGIKAAGGLELVYPGTHYIGHGGEVFPWPINAANGKDLAFYDQNDFGSYKSYHVLGRHSEFFGAYWHDDDFGMGRYSSRDDKLGKKAWIWGLSRQGMIWEQILTDTDGQYVEVQSGRLFNQAAEASSFTPFKHRGFAPHSFDDWTEYWFPVKGTGGFLAANDQGALNVVARGSSLDLRFSPLRKLSDSLEVLDGDRVVFSAPLSLEPMQTWTRTVAVSVPKERLRVRIGDRIEYRGSPDDQLSRPLHAPAAFDWESVQGLWLKGKEWMRQRDYAQAKEALEACLKKDPNYLPALADLALLHYRALDDKEAWSLARRGLAIDTYDPASNYYYALASVRLGKLADAMDGFEVAASDPAFRVAAWTELARLHLAQGRLSKAREYANRALDAEPAEGRAVCEPSQLLLVILRLEGAKTARPDASLDPLAHVQRFERYLAAHDEASRDAVVRGIRNEMPHETFLEIAAWYYGLGRLEEAREALQLAPPQAEVLYWLAYVESKLESKEGGSQAVATAAPADLAQGFARVPHGSALATLQRAEAASPRMVFPFRSESAFVFDWAMREKPDSWRPKYYLALLLWSRNDLAGARRLLQECGGAPDFAAFYAVRAKALEPVDRTGALADLTRAAELDPSEWRYGKLIAERHLEDRDYRRALDVASRYYKQAPSNYILGMLFAKSLLRVGRLADAESMLTRLNVLPYEGATDGRALYRETQLLLGAQAFKDGRTAEALRRVAAARAWPENLGAGKPYPEDTDERLEDWLEARCLEKAGRAAEAAALRERVAKAAPRTGSTTPWPESGTTPEEARILAAWQ